MVVKNNTHMKHNGYVAFTHFKNIKARKGMAFLKLNHK